MDADITPRPVWRRALFMLLMALAYQMTMTLVFIVTVMQFVLLLLSGTANEPLLVFGRSLGRYTQQLVEFLTFVTDIMPFPFSPWPSID
jgi:hypothetical protein